MQDNGGLDDAALAFRDKGILPRFADEAALRASRFVDYLKLVYGADLSFSLSDFPLNLADFDVFYLPLLEQCGLVPQVIVRDTHTCDVQEGALYLNMSNTNDPEGTIWVWKTAPRQAVEAHTWVEVTHCSGPVTNPLEETAMWFYIARGSGNFLQVGRTRAYTDHGDAVRDLMSTDCSDGYNECTSQFKELFSAATNENLDTVQFLRHADMRCGNRAVELVLVGHSGRTSCPKGGLPTTLFASGWQHDKPCVCAPDSHCLSCHGNNAGWGWYMSALLAVCTVLVICYLVARSRHARR